jgi:RHS repeat-associated protein
MVLNNQLQYDSASSGALPVTTPDQLLSLAKQIKLKKSVYMYLWVSNETKGWDVFFDNIKVTHYVGPMVEENHYYPYGLTMAGISDKALKGWYPENKYRYNKGSELQTKEFSDGNGLEIYTTELRTLDPQLGRWWQTDPKIDQGYEGVSPYSSMNNDPIRYSDYLGDEGESCCKEYWEKAKAVAAAFAFMTVHGTQRALTGKGTDFALQVLNSSGSTLNGYLHTQTFGAWSTNPAGTLGIPTQINGTASAFGQAGGIVGPNIFHSAPGANLQLAPASDGLPTPGTNMAPTLPSSTVFSGNTTTDAGKVGFDLSEQVQNTTRIPAPSGKADYRVPDVLNEFIIGEVKNVQKLHLSSQINDYMKYAQNNGLDFKLWIRGTKENPGTKLTAPLQKPC